MLPEFIIARDFPLNGLIFDYLPERNRLVQNTSPNKRTDTASAFIRSSPQIIYEAFLNPENHQKGMKSTLENLAEFIE